MSKKLIILLIIRNFLIESIVTDCLSPNIFALRPIATKNRQGLNTAVFEVWKKIAQIGDLETISAMDTKKFDQRIGAKRISNYLLAHLINGMFSPPNRAWENILRLRKSNEKTDIDILTNLMVACEEINGPGVYYSEEMLKHMDKRAPNDTLMSVSFGAKGERGRAVRTRKGDYKLFHKDIFIHELFEYELDKAGFIDENFSFATKHTHLAVLEHQLRVARLLGVGEFENSLAFVKANLADMQDMLKEFKRRYGLPPTAKVTQIRQRLKGLSGQEEEYDKKTVLGILAAMPKIERLLSLASKSDFYKESLEIWKKAGGKGGTKNLLEEPSRIEHTTNAGEVKQGLDTSVSAMSQEYKLDAEKMTQTVIDTLVEATNAAAERIRDFFRTAPSPSLADLWKLYMGAKTEKAIDSDARLSLHLISSPK